MHRLCRLCIYKAEQLFTTGWMTYAEIVFRYIHSTKLESERVQEWQRKSQSYL